MAAAAFQFLGQNRTVRSRPPTGRLDPHLARSTSGAELNAWPNSMRTAAKDGERPNRLAQCNLQGIQQSNARCQFRRGSCLPCHRARPGSLAGRAGLTLTTKKSLSRTTSGSWIVSTIPCAYMTSSKETVKFFPCHDCLDKGVFSLAMVSLRLHRPQWFSPTPSEKTRLPALFRFSLMFALR